jgi:hypothetical protein
MLPVWKRPEITEICFSGLDRLRSHRDMDTLAVISEKEYRSRCKKHNIEYTFFENSPLGRKKNHGLGVALKKDWDYLIEINSDDILKNELIDLYDTVNYDYVGLRNFCFIDSKTLECRQFQDKTIYGIGRRYSRRLIEKVGELWKDDANIGMDNYANWKIWKQTGTEGKQLFTSEPLAADIKSDVNLWPFNPDLGVKYDIKDFCKGLSQRETDLINGLKN